MFIPHTEKIAELAILYPERIQELELIFDLRTNVYIDYANVRPWATKLGWHIDLKRLKQFLKSFDTIDSVYLYYGTLVGNEASEDIMSNAIKLGYKVKTKPVKIMRLSIDVRRIETKSTTVLETFIKKPLLQIFSEETIALLNIELKELNKKGILTVQDLKSNFDVEIGRDMFRDYDTGGIYVFALWSGDSDFAEPIKQLLEDNKKVVLCMTSGKVSSELNSLRAVGLIMFDIQKIKEFICYKREMAVNLDSKKDPATESLSGGNIDD